MPALLMPCSTHSCAGKVEAKLEFVTMTLADVDGQKVVDIAVNHFCMAEANTCLCCSSEIYDNSHRDGLYLPPEL